jgi:REP element-mobilizing transposase RayT
MPRQARIDSPCALHHIIARGIERSKIFRESADYEDFLQRFAQLLVQTETKCYAWALIPNHFHLLLKTGSVPIATLMLRLLSGYAAGFNRRHHRSGHLFQNRYKSVLCQEDAYLKELVRYIHLNPLRARLVKDLDSLADYPYAGHGVILGKRSCDWQSADSVLSHFTDDIRSARTSYQEYVAEGALLGKQPLLIGGGLVRSAGGWAGVQALRVEGTFRKSDERILGDGEFVESILAESNEQLSRRYHFIAKGITLDHMIVAVAAQTGIEPEQLIGSTKLRRVVRARNLLSYWAVRELGVSMTAVARQLQISLSTVSQAVQKGRRMVKEEGLVLGELQNV